jgi:uncharacterized coiled-coil protein SlyX
MPPKTRGQQGNLTDAEAAEDSRFSKLESKVHQQKRTIDNLNATVDELSGKIDGMVEDLEICKKICKQLKKTLSENTAVTGAHNCIRNKELMFRNKEGDNVVWYETEELENKSKKAAGGKYQGKCYYCGSDSVYVCKGCSTTKKLFWICRELSESQHPKLVSERRTKLNRLGQQGVDINRCWKTHTEDRAFARESIVDFSSSEDDGSNEEGTGSESENN